jgi:hypothetical protein
MLATMACVNGSSEVLDEGTIMPNLTGAADIISNEPNPESIA